MKHCFPSKLAFLFALLALSSATVLKGRKAELKSAVRVKHRQTATKKSVKSFTGGSKAIQRNLAGEGPLVAAVSTPEKAPAVKTRIYTPEELVQKVESYGHQAWECANDLRELINAGNTATDPNASKQDKKAELTLDEELKVKQAISFVKEANTALKYYIDNFILTEEVLQKYEDYIEQHPDQASSTNGVLKFMVHEFRDIQLRKFEREFFEKVKMYNSVLKDKFTPLFFLPLVNKNVHTLQVKLLNGERLIIFIKKYMAFVMRLKRGFHLMDYEKGNQLFREPDVDPKVNRFKIVSNAEFTKVENLRKKTKSYVPVTIVVGNDGLGGKAASLNPLKLPSDYIENKEEIQLKGKQDGEATRLGSGGQSGQTGFGSSLGSMGNDQTRLPSLTDPNSFKTNLPTVDPSLEQGTVMSMSIPAKKLVQENPDLMTGSGNKILPSGVQKKFVNPLDLEKEAFMKQKLAEVERMYGQRSRLNAGLMSQQSVMLDSQPVSHQSNGNTIAPQSIDNSATIAPGSMIAGGDNKANTLMPDEHGGSMKTLNPYDQNQKSATTLANKAGSNQLIETGSENLIELDKDGLPINLEIQRVPEVIRMDERYEDPLVIAGKGQTGLTAKVAEIEGRRVDADFKAQKLTAKPDEQVPQKRVIYHPNEVNGGLPQPKAKDNIDQELGQIDEIIRDNGTVDKTKLRRVDKMLGLSSPRSLWDQDLGKVYSKLRWHGLI